MSDTPEGGETSFWYVYLLHSERTGHTYKGIGKDPERRLRQHNGLRSGGAKRTRAGRPWTLRAAWGPYRDRSEASKKEAQLQKRSGLQSRMAWNPEERVKLGDLASIDDLGILRGCAT